MNWNDKASVTKEDWEEAMESLRVPIKWMEPSNPFSGLGTLIYIKHLGDNIPVILLKSYKPERNVYFMTFDGETYYECQDEKVVFGGRIAVNDSSASNDDPYLYPVRYLYRIL